MKNTIQVERTRSNCLPVAITRKNVTDRALRYRANQEPPEGEPICSYCGSEQNVEIEHIDGHEENNDPQNKTWACRQCNTTKGVVMRNAGLGRRTRQYNPSGEGAKSLEQWVTAVLSMKGESSAMSVSDAVNLIHDTPQERRSRFGKQIWSLRRQHGTDKTGTPF